MFQSTYNRGFTLRFSNGYTVSVQFPMVKGYGSQKENPIEECIYANVAIMDSNDKAVVVDGNSAVFRQLTDNVADILKVVKDAKSVYDIRVFFEGEKEESWE